MKVRFKISEEKFFNNGKIILNSLPDIDYKIRTALSQEEDISVTHRESKGKQYNGVTAASLNKALRRCLNKSSIKGETHVENGVFFHDTKEGFDFSVYDEEYNMSRLYNYYQGTIGILNGDKKILNLHKKMGYKKKEWKEEIKKIQSDIELCNSDYVVDKRKLTVVGELQFGNWALIYRDLFRLLDADSNPGIDFYIYVAADKNLSGLLSAQTVSYKRANDVISEYLSIIKTPIWLISLGIEEL